MRKSVRWKLKKLIQQQNITELFWAQTILTLLHNIVYVLRKQDSTPSNYIYIYIYIYIDLSDERFIYIFIVLFILYIYIYIYILFEFIPKKRIV